MASKRAPAGQDPEPAKKSARRPAAKASTEVEKADAPIKVASTRADGGPAKELALRPKAGRLGAVGATHQIQTTMRPDLTITVSETEYQSLLAQGLVYSGSPVAPVADFYDGILADKVANGAAFPQALGDAAADSTSPFGSELRAALASPFGRRVPSGNIAVAMGDSRTIRFTADTNGPGWFPQLCARSNQRIQYGGVYAVSGYTIENVRDSLLPTVLALSGAQKPAAAFLMVGVNDYEPPATWDFEASKAAHAQIIDGLIKAGIVPIVCLDLPVTGGSGNVHIWNRYLRTMCHQRGLVPPVDFFRAVVDPIAGGWTAAWADDSKHPNEHGCRQMAEYAIAQGAHLVFPPPPAITCVSPADTLNKVPSATALFLTDSNADGRSDGWSGNGTGTVTYSRIKPAATDYVSGFWQRASVTGPRTVSGTTTLVTLSISGAYSVGDQLEFSCRVRTTGVEAAGGQFTVRASIASNLELRGAYQWKSDIANGVLYARGTVPAGGSGTSNVQLLMYDPTGTGTFTVDIAECAIRNLTTGDLLTVPAFAA